MPRRTLFVVTACSVALLAVSLTAAELVNLDKALCPVSGKAVTEDASVEYKGGKVLFCCPGCPGGFEKNTAKFAAKANHQLVLTGQAKQKACPLAGRPIAEDKSLEVAGVKVNVCCGNCLKKANDTEDKVNLLFSDAAFGKGFEVKAKE